MQTADYYQIEIITKNYIISGKKETVIQSFQKNWRKVFSMRI